MRTLPAGLIVHCASCNVVTPADAPRPNEPDCAGVLRARMTGYNPAETIAGQFTMAAAAWAMIHHKALSPAVADQASTTYWKAFRTDRKNHWVASAAYKGMSPQQRQLERSHRRDGWLYA